MVILTAEEYLMDCVQGWNCKNYHKIQTESALKAAWQTVGRLRKKCIEVYPSAYPKTMTDHPYREWNWLFQVYIAIQRDRPDIACAYALDLLHFTAVGGNYEKRVLAVLIRVLEGRHSETWQPVFAEAEYRQEKHKHHPRCSN